MKSIPQLPKRHGQWSNSTVEQWQSWFESDVASKWTAAQVKSAGRLLFLTDNLSHADDQETILKLNKEIRLAETALGLTKQPSRRPRPLTETQILDRAERVKQFHIRSTQRRRDQLESRGITEDELAREELEPLSEQLENTNEGTNR